MKKAFSVAIMVGLVAASLAMPAEAAKKKKKKPQRVERTVESVYQAPAIGTSTSGGACLNATASCGRSATGPDDLYVKVDVKDATPATVPFTLGQDTDPATLGTELIYGDYCGTTGDEPIKLDAPGAEVLVFVWAFGDIVCPGGFATTGTVSLKFSNLP